MRDALEAKADLEREEAEAKAAMQEKLEGLQEEIYELTEENEVLKKTAKDQTLEYDANMKQFERAEIRFAEMIVMARRLKTQGLNVTQISAMLNDPDNAVLFIIIFFLNKKYL